MKLYTKTGDQGETGLIGGRRVPKHHPRVAAYGEVDELCAAVGLAVAAFPAPGPGSHGGSRAAVASASAGAALPPLRAALEAVQADLFVMGADLANPGEPPTVKPLGPKDIERLEHWIDAAVAPVPELRTFILPGGCEAAARLHVARTVCRRAERSVMALQSVEPVDATSVVYLNRLADLLFALARLTNHQAGIADVPWTPRGAD